MRLRHTRQGFENVIHNICEWKILTKNTQVIFLQIMLSTLLSYYVTNSTVIGNT